MLKRSVLLFIQLCLLILLVAGCNNGSSSDEGEETAPLPEQKVSGIWWGYITPAGSSANEFVMGVITEENEVRLVSDTSQYVGPQGALEVYPNTVYASGAFSAYLYDAATPADYFDVTTSTSNYTGFILSAALILEETGPSGGDTLQLYYNTTYEDVTPNVASLKGVWHLANTAGFGGKISLVITPDVADTTAGGDIRVKRGMSGTDLTTGTDILNPGRIEVYYSNSRTYNIYNVNLSTLDSIDLSGFAAYINEYNTKGLVKSRMMSIGVSGAPSGSPGNIKSFSGLASFYKTLTP